MLMLAAAISVIVGITAVQAFLFAREVRDFFKDGFDED
jgi:hypothetical protein